MNCYLFDDTHRTLLIGAEIENIRAVIIKDNV